MMRRGKYGSFRMLNRTAPVGDDLSRVEQFYRRGIRHMLMAYNAQNLAGYGCHEAEDRGLTPFGRELIREMNRVGMLVDVAHTGYRTAMETIEASTAPVVISHGNVWELGGHPGDNDTWVHLPNCELSPKSAIVRQITASDTLFQAQWGQIARRLPLLAYACSLVILRSEGRL